MHACLLLFPLDLSHTSLVYSVGIKTEVYRAQFLSLQSEAQRFVMHNETSGLGQKWITESLWNKVNLVSVYMLNILIIVIVEQEKTPKKVNK